jgi:hypothetical protein
LNEDTRLIVGVCGENLGFLGGNGGVALDEGSHHTANSLDTKREGSNVEEQDNLGLLRSITRELDGGLNGSTICSSLIAVDALVGSLPLKESETSLMIRGIRVEPPTRTISWTLDLSILESRRTFLTGSRVRRKDPGRAPRIVHG